MPICSECKNDYSPPTLCGICPDCQQTIVGLEPLELNPGSPVFENAVYKIPSPKQQKHEKIEKIFEKIVVETLLFDNQLEKWTTESFDETWSLAERIFDFLKKKQEGAE